MKSGMRSRRHGYTMVVVLFVWLGVLAACSNEPPAPVAPTSAPAAVIPTLAPTTASETPASAAEGNTGTDAALTGLPESIVALLPSANVAHGGELVVQQGCTACHSMEKDMKVIGPSFYASGQIAATRVAGESAGLYLYNSILHPNQYVVDTFLPGLMPQTYGDQLSEQELADVIAYLLTLQAE